MIRPFTIVFSILLVLAIGPALADEHAAEEAAHHEQPRQSVTQHQIRIDGEVVRYTATTGWLIQEKDGEPVARFGYTAYVRDGDFEPGERPLMFAFNGGPGSSSIWLHMGILGPQRVVVDDPNYTPPPPAKRVDNEFSILDKTDLVMVDPVGTGFSRPIGEADGELFWGVDQDIESVGAFIKQYITEQGRWASPKFILGESYGGIRGAGLAHHLQSRHGMNLNGVILVSPFMDTSAGRDGEGLDLPHALFLSGFAATAWYHGVLDDANGNRPTDLATLVDEVDRFALDVYLPALTAGYTLDPARKRAVAEQLAEYTGVSAEYWDKADLRVDHVQFLQELMRDERMIAGRIDSRFIGPSVNPLSETMDYDPFFPAVGPAYTAAFLDYLHNDLDFGRDLEYKTSAWPLDWDWSHRGPNGRRQVAVSLLPDMSMALIMNPGLHLHLQQGYYDMATPVGATNYYVRHLDIPMEARERIRVDYYGAGHMMYLHQPSMQKYRDDLVAFIEGAIPE
ncbi:MAG: carboxypeptidase [Pseudomonadota bacterium]